MAVCARTVNAVGSGERDADGGGGVSDDEDARAGDCARLEVLDELVPLGGCGLVVELEDLQRRRLLVSAHEHAIAPRRRADESDEALLHHVVSCEDDGARVGLGLAQSLEVGDEGRVPGGVKLKMVAFESEDTRVEDDGRGSRGGFEMLVGARTWSSSLWHCMQ